MPNHPPSYRGRGSSKYRGISHLKSGRHTGWRAQIGSGHDRVVAWPRAFATPEEAARVYDVMAIYVRGPDAKLNFDGQPPVGVSRAEIKNFLARHGFLPRVYYDSEPPQFRQ